MPISPPSPREQGHSTLARILAGAWKGASAPVEEGTAMLEGGINSLLRNFQSAERANQARQQAFRAFGPVLVSRSAA